jgi:putative ABC transport system permease protein
MLQAPYRAQWTVSLVARAGGAGDEGPVASALRDVVRQYDPDVPVDLSSLEAMVSGSVADRRLLLTLVAAFAGLALLLAASGIYSVLSQSVAQRTAEIGIRMALGADGGRVVRLMLRHAMSSVAIGVLTGAAGAIGTMRLLQSFLFEIRPLDPGAFAGAVLLLAIVALLAAFVPARRATRVDPLRALRTP